jgi:hypothetical protein
LKLRVYKFTPLFYKAKVTPGYSTTSRGSVYFDRYSVDELRCIGESIRREFYTFERLIKVLKKFIRIGFASERDLAALIFHTPLAPLLPAEKKKRETRARRKAMNKLDCTCAAD